MYFAFLLPIVLLSTANAETPSRQLRGSPRGEKVGGSAIESENCLVCNVKKADIQYLEDYTGGGRSDYWICETEATDEPDKKANQRYVMDDLPNEFLEKYERQLQNGQSQICIPNGKANRWNHKVEIPKNASPKYLGERHDKNHGQRGHRQLGSTGTHTVLAVIVTSSKTGERDPKLNASTIAGNLFGIGPMAQNSTVAAQYQACSNGKLKMVPYTGKGIVDGVMSVSIPTAISGTPTLTTLQNAVISATLTALNITDIRFQAADHILFCLPTGGMISGSNSWVSYGILRGVTSFYQQSMCAKLSAPMHEIGHHLGFQHSGKGTFEYGDNTGYMGAAYDKASHPFMCFNGHKNYISGWFDDRKVSINPLNGTWGGSLIGAADYTAAAGTLPNATVIVNVGNVYIQLNSAKKHNYETKAGQNKVNIVSADLPSVPTVVSWLIASLGSGESFVYPNFTFSNGTKSNISLVIQVCSITLGTIDTARVSIYLQDGKQKSNCDQIK